MRTTQTLRAAVAAAALLLLMAGEPAPAAAGAFAEKAPTPQTLQGSPSSRAGSVDREPLSVSYRAPFVWPLGPDAELTDGFGPRTAPTAGASTAHAGVDFAAPLGTPVRSAAPGTVRETTGDVGGCGVSVTVDHVVLGERFSTVYCHLGAGTVAAAPGDRVLHGDVIAQVGSTGTSTGPHLHFEVRDAAGLAGDPLHLLARAL